MKANIPTPVTDMGQGNVSSVLARLSGPAMTSMFFQNLYSLVDTLFVSWVSTTALAALSLAVPLTYIALALCRGVGSGTTALMSHGRGAGRTERVAALAGSALPLMLLVLAPLLILAVPAPCKAVFRLLGAHGDVEGEVYRYALWMALGFPLMGYVTICESIYMSHGDTRTPMKAMILGNLANLALDPVFIFSLGMGVEGASLATFIGWLLSAGFMGWQLGRQGGMIRPSIVINRDTLDLWRAIGALGSIIALTLLVQPVSFGVINKILADHSLAAVGAWNVMMRVELMIVLPLFGLSNALIPFMGYNLGQGDYGRIKTGVVYAIKFGLAVMAAASILLLVFVNEVLYIFRLDEQVFALSCFALRNSALGIPFFVFELVLMGVSQGLRHPKYSLLMNCFRLLIIRIPLALLFAAEWGARGVYVSHPTATVIASLLASVLLVHLLRKARKEADRIASRDDGGAL